MSINIEVQGGTSVRLTTAGKYCDRDIVVTATGGGGADDMMGKLLDGTITELKSDVTFVSGHACRGRASLVSVDLPNASEIGTYGFNSCTKLKTFNAPKLATVGTYCFASSSALETVVLPNVTLLANYTFQQCKALRIADFLKLRRINASAFNSCTKLEALILRITGDICTLNANSAFTGSSVANGTGYIYTHENLIDDYASATNWSTHAAQLRPLVATVADLASIDGSVYDRAWVDDENCAYIYDGSAWAKGA